MSVGPPKNTGTLIYRRRELGNRRCHHQIGTGRNSPTSNAQRKPWYTVPGPNCRVGPIKPLRYPTAIRSLQEDKRRTKNIPNSTRTKKHAIVWTRELVVLSFCTNILDSRKQHLLYPDLQYSSEKGSDRLDYERCTGRDLDVVAQLEVLGE